MTTQRRPRRRRAIALGAAGLLLALLAPIAATAAPVDDLETELHESRDRLSSAQGDLESTAAAIADARRRLDRIDGRLRGATDRLGALETELDTKRAALATAESQLAEAEDTLAAAEAATARATSRLEAATERLRRTENELDHEQSTLESQAAHAYKHGGGSQLGELVETVLRAESPSDAAVNWRFVESAFGHQKSIVEDIAVLRELAARHRIEVEEARRQRLAEEAAAREAREDVARLTAERRELVAAQQRLVREQEQLVASVRSDQRRQKKVLSRLQSDRAAYEALVDRLERESRSIARELADAREQARREALRARQSSGSGSGGSSGQVVRSSGRWTAGAPGKDGMVWPTTGSPGSGFGYRTHPVYGTRRLHSGVDIAAPTGQSIVAAKAGLVVYAGWRGGYGNTVIIDHGGGLATLYAHQSRLAAHVGQSVSTGQAIGHIGSTGMSTGPHLHFEVRVNGEPRDPMNWY